MLLRALKNNLLLILKEAYCCVLTFLFSFWVTHLSLNAMIIKAERFIAFYPGSDASELGTKMIRLDPS